MSLPRASGVDACPGALRLHDAADGPLARVRLPGGLLTGAQVGVLRSLAERWGDGGVEITSRANVQLRALRVAPASALAGPLAAAGLLPSQTHERVRNIVAAPLSSAIDVRAFVADLDAALCASPRLASLPGRFLFALGDLTAAADLTAIPVSAGTFAVLFAGADAGLRVPADRVVPALIASAHAFLDERDAQGGGAWRLRELSHGPARVAARTATALDLPHASSAAPGLAGAPAGPFSAGTAPGPAALGLVRQPDGMVAAVALVPLGRLGPAALTVLARAELLAVTTWRGVVVPDLRPEAARRWLGDLAAAGLEVSSGSRWIGVTACAGRPHCARALADVRREADAASGHDTAGVGVDLLAVHWIGCARGCGSPSGAHVRVEATGDGYRVSAPGFERDAQASEVDAVVAAARAER